MYKHMIFTKIFMNTHDAIIELDRLINMEIWIQLDDDCEHIYGECHICNNSTLLHGYYKYNDGKSGIDLIKKYDHDKTFCKSCYDRISSDNKIEIYHDDLNDEEYIFMNTQNF